MLKKRWLLLLLLLLFVGVLGAGSWLLTSRAGALWLLDRYGSSGLVRIGLHDFQGSLLGGFDLQELRIEWPGGRLSTDRVTLKWRPSALLQQQLQIDLLQGGTLALQLSDGAENAQREAADSSALPVPDFSPLFAVLKNWSVDLRQLQLAALKISYADGEVTLLQELACHLSGSSEGIRLQDAQFDGDWGSWQGSLLLAGAEPLLTGRVDWQPPAPFGPLEKFAAQLDLRLTERGGVAGPVELAGAGQGGQYRLSGELYVDLAGLQLKALTLDRGASAGGLARGELSLDWQQEFGWATVLALDKLDLSAETGHPTSISGKIALTGAGSRYTGRADLRNEVAGWEQSSLAGDLSGNSERLDLSQIQGRLLGGTIRGTLGVDWRAGVESRFRLEAEDLQLARLPQGPDGRFDLLVDGWLRQGDATEPQLGGLVQVKRGILLGREFTGELSGEWQGGRRLKLDRLEMNGDWGELRAQGDLQRQLDLRLSLVDAAGLWPPLEAEGEVAGWLAWTGDWPHGELNARLKKLAYADWQLGALQLEGKMPTAKAEAALHLRLSQLQKGENRLEDLDLTLKGLPGSHQVNLWASDNFGLAEVELQGEMHENGWQGRISSLDLNAERIESFALEAPVDLSFNAKEARFSDVLLQGDKGGRMRLSGQWSRQDLRAQLEGGWTRFNLSWLNLWLTGMRFDGESSGSGKFTRGAAGNPVLELELGYVGAFGYAGQQLQLDKAQLAGEWDEQGLAIDAEIFERSGGVFRLVAQSGPVAGFSVPQRGDFHLNLSRFPLGLLNASMPTGTEVRGLLAAEVTGRWFDQDQFALTGRAGVEQGFFSYQGGARRLDLPLEQAALDIAWQQGELQTRVDLGLDGGDELVGNITLALPASWPVDLAQRVPLAGEIRFELGRLGILTLMTPAQLTDVSGQAGGVFRLGGSLQEPVLEGDLHLSNGRVNLPQLGIELADITVAAMFSPQQLQIEQISLSSGEGRLHGRGVVLFDGWTPKLLKIGLKGEDVLIANLPELRALASPDLQIVGNAQGFTLGGTLKIPELQIINWHPAGRIARSDDVIYVDQLPKPEAPTPFRLILDLDVELGDKVAVKDRGLDVRLKGRVRLTRTVQGEVLARGQIDIPEGHYSAYGVKLPITTGRLFFNGGQVDNPALDIIAEKKVGEVKAGVAVGGTVRRPEIRLISDPALDDTNILSYIVLGRSTTGSSGDFSALSLAAGALLSAGDSASFQQQLQHRSGLDVLDVNTGAEGTLETSVVTVGKYLTPELYLSYGRALSGTSSQVQLRYSPSKRVDIESQFGEVSGADIYYKIEFD